MINHSIAKLKEIKESKTFNTCKQTKLSTLRVDTNKKPKPTPQNTDLEIPSLFFVFNYH